MADSPPIFDVLSSSELLTAIATHLTPHDLAQCVLVSKAFAQTFTPRLWHTITLKREQQQERFTKNDQVKAALRRNSDYIHIIRVLDGACLAPFITTHGILMRNLHTLEFPWTMIPLIISRGLAPPGQRKGLWPLFELRETSECANREAEIRAEEEQCIAEDTERTAEQIMSDNFATSTEGSTLDWLRLRVMYPMRRQQIMEDLISTRAYQAYKQDRIRYTEEVQLGALPGLDPKHWKQQAMQRCRKSRCQLQDTVDEIKAFSKQNPTRHFHGEIVGMSESVRQRLHELKSRFSAQLLRLEKDEAKLAGPPIDFAQRCATLRDYVLGLIPHMDEPQQQQQQYILSQLDTIPFNNRNARTANVMIFLRLYQTIRTFRDYDNHLDAQEIWGDYNDMIPSYMRSMRHLSWTVWNGSISERHHSYRKSLEDFLRSPYLRLVSLRLSFSYHSALDNNASACSTSSYLLDNDTSSTTENDKAKLLQRVGPIPSLTHLTIEDCMAPGILIWSKDYRIPAWVPFLQRCPNLRSLALGSCPPPIWFEIARLLQAHCPRIEDLAIAYGRQFSNQCLDKCDPALAALLFACSHPHMDDTFGEDDATITEEPIEPTMGLKRLRLDALVLPAKSHALHMLLDYHSGSLTHLGIMDCKNLQKKGNRTTLLKILRSFGELEEIHLLPSGEVEYVEEDHVFDAQALIDSVMTPTQYTTAICTWACEKSLKVLRMMIGGLVRTPLSSTSSTMDTTPDGALDLQRQVYRLIGSLTQLEELCLGFGTEEDSIFTLPQQQGRQEDCLEFSLDSGLELLEGLKSLRVLNVSRMSHRIVLAEVQWMCAQWPRLHAIEGLLRVKSLERSKAENENVCSEVLIEEREREEEIVCWLKQHRPQLMFT
ncbi:hypothetical protein BGX33_004981 [Mortierella sp. NVP41]|nr:hypothetical protein BGX33_004981 [Mortierella sp. NVP41]